MNPKAPLQTPLKIAAIDNEIVFLGEGAVNFSMTEEAARATLLRLAAVLDPAQPIPFGGYASPPVILMVEDELMIREVMSALLLDAGYVVIEAESAGEALIALEAGAEINLLFTDIQLPGELDGLALARQVRDRWPAVAVLVSSGRIRPEADALHGVWRFMQKPYEASEMLRHVGDLTAH